MKLLQFVKVGFVSARRLSSSFKVYFNVKAENEGKIYEHLKFSDYKLVPRRTLELSLGCFSKSYSFVLKERI